MARAAASTLFSSSPSCGSRKTWQCVSEQKSNPRPPCRPCHRSAQVRARIAMAWRAAGAWSTEASPRRTPETYDSKSICVVTCSPSPAGLTRTFRSRNVWGGSFTLAKAGETRNGVTELTVRIAKFRFVASRRHWTTCRAEQEIFLPGSRTRQDPSRFRAANVHAFSGGFQGQRLDGPMGKQFHPELRTRRTCRKRCRQDQECQQQFSHGVWGFCAKYWRRIRPASGAASAGPVPRCKRITRATSGASTGA